MKNFLKYILLSLAFSKKYFWQYLKLLIKPILVGIIGILSVSLVYINPLLAIVALFISIPCVCYAFWNGYVTTYSLNNAARFLIDNQDDELKNLLITKEQRQELAKYLGFCALIFIIACLPMMIIAGKSIDIISLLDNPANFSSVIQNLNLNLIVLITTIIFFPFFNFFNQALYFKKEEENFINLFLNCYKKLDKTGILLAISFTIIGGVVSLFFPILSIPLNLIFFSANAFWFYDKVKETEI